MSYDIHLYQPAFLKRALDENLGDWTAADPIPEHARSLIRTRLFEKGYLLDVEQEDHCEFVHANEEWGLQVSLFKGELAFSVPYWDDVGNAVEQACRDAKELATLTGLAYYDPQTGEVTFE